MAKKDKLKLDNFDFDDGLDLPDFDFGGDKVPDNRKPTTKIKDSIIAGTKQSLSSASTYQKLMRHALPSEYGETYDSADRIGQNMRRIYNDAVKEVKPASADLARAMGTFVPESMKRTKKALDKIEKWGTGEPELRSDPNKVREDGIAVELGKVFKTQFEEDLKDKAEQRSRRKVDDALGVIRHRDQMSMLNQMAIDMRRLSQYETTVTQAFQKKSLELQYRSYYVQADMLELQRKTTIAITSRLDSIAKNTGLPDFVKTRKSEYMKEQLRNNFLQGTIGGLFGNTRDQAERFFENIGRKVRAGASEAASIFSAAAMGSDMASTVSDMSNESFLEMAAREGTGMAISGQAGRAGAAIRRKMKKHAPGLTNKIESGAEQIRFMRQNGLDSLLSWARSPDKGNTGGTKNFVIRLIKDLLADNIDKRSSETKLTMDQLSELRDPVAFNLQTQKSITEIIPGFLSRILREITVLRTGDEKTSLVAYDFKGNKFAATKGIVKDLVANAVKKDSSEYLARNAESYLESFGLNDKLKPAEKKALVKHLLTTRFEGGGFDRDTFTDVNKMAGMNPRHAARIAKVFDTYYEAEDVQSSDRKLIQKRRRANLAEWGHRLGDEMNDPRSMIQQYANAGQTELLREAGLINDDNEVNMKALIERAVENVGTIKSDMFLKENIKSFSPSKALNAIRDVGVKLWNYKKGSNADDGGQMHIGPMAQDLNSAMGEDVAPRGKKINLANLVSANMAAVQGLDKKVQSVGDALKAQVALVTQYMGGKARSFKDNFTSQSMEQMDHPPKPEWLKDDGIPRSGKDPTIKERIKTIEELLVMIASNTSAGGGIRFDQMFVRDGKLSKFRTRWPSLFRARRKSQEEEKTEDTENKRKRSYEPNDILGNISDALHSGLQAGTAISRKGLASIMKGYSQAKDTVLSFTDRFAKPVFDEALKKGENAAKTLRDRLNGVDDIYVDGETQPRIYKTKMLQGLYIDFNTGNVIKCIRDIMGPVMDSSDNTIVVSDEEVGSLVLRSTVVSKTIQIGKDLIRGVNNSVKHLIKSSLPHGWNMVLSAGKSFRRTLLNFIDEPRDVYVQGEDKPRLFMTGFLSGLYYLKSDGMVIRRPGQITDEVIDKEGNILLSKDDISKGLFDAKGEKIASIATRFKRFSESSLKTGTDFIHMLLRGGKNMWENLKKVGKHGLQGLFNGINFGIGGKESLDVLKQIRDILDGRLPGGKSILGDRDGDGDRDGSWQDIFQNKKDKEQTAAKKGPDVKSYRNGNVLDKAQEAITGLIGNVIDGAAGLLGLGGLFGKGKGTGGEKAAGEALKKSGRFAGLLNKIKGFGALGTIGSVLGGGLLGGNIFKTAGSKLAGVMPSFGSGAASGGLPTIDPSMMDNVPLDAMVKENVITTAEKKTLEKGGPAAEALVKKKPGLLARIHSSGMRGVTGVGKLAGRMLPGVVKTGAGAIGAGVQAAKGIGWGLGKLGTGISMAGKGVGMLGRGAMRMLPGLGVGYGLYSAANNAIAGNYGSAALDLGIAGVSAVGVGGALSMLGTGAGALAAAMFSPIGLGVIGAAVVGYGLFKAYKWITKKDYSPLSKLRMFQYGIGDQDEKYREQIYNLEKMLQPGVQVSGNQAKIDEGKVDVKEVLKIFGIKEEDQDSINRFGIWFGQRFKPVYLTHMAAIFKAKGKLDIDLIDNDLKEAKEKLDFLKEVAMSDGPWQINVLPFPQSPKSVVGGATIREVVEGLRKSFEAGLKPEDLKPKDSWIKSLFSSAPKDPKGTVTDIKPTENKDELSKKISQAMRSDIMLKGGMASVSIGSDKTGNWFNNGLITAFDAVRFKAYGLEKTSQALVASIRWLEDAVLKDIKRLPDNTAQWSGKPEEMLELSRRFFGFDFNDQKQDVNWINWFLRRFLPIYTTVVNKQAQVIGNDNFDSHRKAFNQVSVEAIQICEHICTMASAWRVSDSPWPGVKLISDPSVAKENIDYIKKTVKDKEIDAQKEKERKASAGVSDSNNSSSSSSRSSDEADKQDLKDSMTRAAATKAAIEAGRKSLEARGKVSSGASGDGEPDQKPMGESASVSKAAVSVSGVKSLAHASGELSSGSGVEQYLKLKGGVTLEGTHPLFLKLLLGSIQEYGEKTGKQVLINEGFRTRAQQEALKAKYGPRAAAPGSSLHEFGLAVDMSSADADAMEKMGLFRKYGLTRPVGAEPWHIEPAGIQMAYNTYKKDWNMATAAIESGIGKGGGGAGTLSNAPKYGRMPELAKALLQQQTIPGEGVVDNKDQMAQAMAKQAIGNASASSRVAVQQKDGTTTLSGGNSTGSYAGNIQATGNVIPDIGAPPNTQNTASSGPGESPPMKALLDQISNGEGTTDEKAKAAGFQSAYDVPLNYGRFGKPDKPLSSMSLGEVKDYQKVLLKNSGSLNSSAVGKYQIVGRTLGSLQRKMGLSDNEMFSPQLQDKMAVELLKGRGLNKYMSGKMSARDFQANLYHEWASIAHPDTGKGKQGTGTTNAAIQPLLAGLRGEASPAPNQNDAGINYIASSSAPGSSTSSVGAMKTSYGTQSTVNAATSFETPSRINERVISEAYRTNNAAPVARVQPEIRKSEEAIVRTVENVGSILTNSLDVQKSILEVLRNMSMSKSNNTSNTPEKNDDPISRIAKPIGESPISVRSRMTV